MKGLYIVTFLVSSLLPGSFYGQDKPTLTFPDAGKVSSPSRSVLFDQMDNPGTNSITSQNFESANDIFDSFAADDFAFMDDTWSIGSVEVAGVYYNGSGPATSVNVWIYSSDGSGGLPQNIIFSALNIVPSAGLADGSFTIDLPIAVVLTEGWYWLCVQANMNYSSGGQWGWTGRTIQSFSESAWMNPAGGFGTPCTPSWGYRLTDCSVGTEPDNCFRINGDIVPVELTSFTAIVNGKEVMLNWSTATETNNRGFEVEKKVGSKKYAVVNGWDRMGFVEGHGTSSEVNNYTFIDKNIGTGKYLYRLKQFDFDGSYEYSDIVEVDVNIPLEFSLGQNYPNPFNPGTKISWQSPVANWQTLKVYDILGNEVATLVDEYKSAGNYEVEFDASKLTSGIYFYQLKTGTFMETQKMILIK